MKRVSFGFFSLLMLGATAFAQPALVPVPLEKAYLPHGFDDNDIVQIYVTGKYRNTCFQDGPYQVETVGTVVTITQKAYQYPGTRCWPVAMPFERTITFPEPLGKGSYEIRDGANGQVLGTISVEEAKNPGPGRDEFPYAPASDVVLKPLTPFGHSVVVRGIFPNDCLKIQSLTVLQQSNVLVVLPIMGYEVPASGKCHPGLFPFRAEARVPHLLAQHKYLIHVRSSKGVSVNSLIDPYGAPDLLGPVATP